MFLEKFIDIIPISEFNCSTIKINAKYFDIENFTEEVLKDHTTSKEYIQCKNLIKYSEKDEKKYLKFKPLVCYFCCKINECIRLSNLNYNNKLMTILIDVQGIKSSQFNLTFSKHMINICETFYSDKLKLVVFLNYSKLFRGLYCIVKPFIDKDTRKKFIFKKDGKEIKDYELTLS